MQEKTPQEWAKESYEAMKNLEDFMVIVYRATADMTIWEWELFRFELKKLIRQDKKKS